MFYVLVLLVAASRFLPHPPNVACVGALGLFAGCYLSGRKAFLIPLGALFLSDLAGHLLRVPGMGFYSLVTMACVYCGVLLSVPLGRWLRAGDRRWKVPAASLAASTVFFVISNFGVWLGPWYPATPAGLVHCYTNAIPFFGYTIAGDMIYTVLLVTAWEFKRSSMPQWKLQLSPTQMSK